MLQTPCLSYLYQPGDARKPGGVTTKLQEALLEGRIDQGTYEKLKADLIYPQAKPEITQQSPTGQEFQSITSFFIKEALKGMLFCMLVFTVPFVATFWYFDKSVFNIYTLCAAIYGAWSGMAISLESEANRWEKAGRASNLPVFILPIRLLNTVFGFAVVGSILGSLVMAGYVHYSWETSPWKPVAEAVGQITNITGAKDVAISHGAMQGAIWGAVTGAVVGVAWGCMRLDRRKI